MWIATCRLPKELEDALDAGQWSALAQREGTAPDIAFARGIAKSNLQRSEDALADFDAASASDALRDPAAIEAGFLEVGRGHFDAEVLALAPQIAERATDNALLRARANHLTGLVAFKRMNASAALDPVSASLRDYSGADCTAGVAQTLDTLGMIHQWLGNATPALTHYSRSLAVKTRAGDEMGSAITLGNLGRLCLQLGRLEDARAFLEMDLALARAMADTRGQARVLNDLGRVARQDGDTARAGELFREGLSVAEAAGLTRIAFECTKDLAEMALAQGPAEDARRLLADATRRGEALASPYDKLLLQWLQAQSLLASDTKAAAALLEEVVAGFRDSDLSAQEIDARLALSQALVAVGNNSAAQEHLLVALKRAKSRALNSQVVRIREAMEQLSLTDGVSEESGRPIDDSAASAADGYLLRERLGGGAFGSVWRAVDVDRGLEVALKILDLETTYEAGARTKLMDSARLELEAAGRARHPGLVRVLAIGRDAKGNLYLAQELIRGKALRVVMSEGTVHDPKRIAHYLAQVADALAALHAQGVVHRDLKPENVMIREDGRPVLIDFGIAHIAGLAALPGAFPRGTPHYMAPEQAKGEAATPAFDTYALGVIAYEWVHGARPDDDGQKAPSRGIVNLLLKREPADMNELIAQLLAARDRLSDAAAIAGYLRKFAA